jgi:hypothetical protein
VDVCKNVLSNIKIQENGGKESLAFLGSLNEFISLLSTFIVVLGRNSA